MENEVVKRSVGRPKKDVQIVSVILKVENIAKPTPNRAKVRGNYVNWFTFTLGSFLYCNEITQKLHLYLALLKA